MATLTPTPSIDVSIARTAPRSRVGVFVELTKIRLSALVLVTGGVGFLLGAGGAVDGWLFLATLAGIALLAGGANVWNQCLEVVPDSRMRRTRRRPLPAGRISMRGAVALAIATTAGGIALLYAFAGALPAGLGFLTVFLYVVVYTPLKRVTTLCTPVGAIVGALPPVIGWAASAGRIESGAMILAAVMFIWQIPHFLAIAWLYREDYERGGFRMLPVLDESGHTTFRMVVIYCGALLPVTVFAALLPSAGWLYLAGAILLGAAFLLAGVRLYRERSRGAARRLFLMSIAYLPLLFALLVLDPTGGAILR